MLKDYIFRQKQHKDILLMTHIVIGYPSLIECFYLIVEMNKVGVDIIELQIPTKNADFDGTTIRKANARAISNGADIEHCFTFASYITRTFSIPIVFVAYYETVKNYGYQQFFNETSNCNVAAVIIPDIPEQEQYHWHKSAFTAGISIAPVIFPKSSSSTYTSLLEYSEFCYCATHNGYTGNSINFDGSLRNYIESVKRNTMQPVAVGFGIKTKSHINFLKGYADIAAIGTKIMQIIDADGIDMAGKYLEHLSYPHSVSSRI